MMLAVVLHFQNVKIHSPNVGLPCPPGLTLNKLVLNINTSQ